MAQVKIELPDSNKDKLRALAEQQGLKLASHCRRIIQFYLSNPEEFESLAANLKLKQANAIQKAKFQ